MGTSAWASDDAERLLRPRRRSPSILTIESPAGTRRPHEGRAQDVCRYPDVRYSGHELPVLHTSRRRLARSIPLTVKGDHHIDAEDPPPKKTIHIVLKPEIDELDGRWTARYPGESWSVSADSRQGVIDKLIEEHERRATTRESLDSLLAVVDKSRNVSIPGVEVQELTGDEYQEHMQENTQRIARQDDDK